MHSPPMSLDAIQYNPILISCIYALKTLDLYPHYYLRQLLESMNRKNHPLYRYGNPPAPPANSVQLDISDVSEDSNPQPKKKLIQPKLDAFLDRLKTRKEFEMKQSQQQKQIISSKLNSHDFGEKPPYCGNKSERIKPPQQIHPVRKLERQQAVPIFTRSNQKDRLQKEKLREELQNRIREQKRAKKLAQKQARKEQEKARAEAQRKRKKAGLDAFFDGVIAEDEAKCTKVNNLDIFNSFEAEKDKSLLADTLENPNKGSNLANNGLIYRKQKIERQKMPLSFLKMLLSYKFSEVLPIPETRKVPNIFEDQLTYKKVFHYLVTNQCIADIHARIMKIEETRQNTILSVVIADFKKDSDGFVKLSIYEHEKGTPMPVKSSEAKMKDVEKQRQAIKKGDPESANKAKDKDKQKQKAQKEKYMLKNLSLSRNRLGILTNAKNFRMSHYGIPCKKNDHIFAFLCMLITPESKQDLSGEVKVNACFNVNQLEMIMKLNKSNRAYFIDLEKISTHIREYSAITHLYDTEVAPFVYNPPLIEKYQFDMVTEAERQLLSPILNTLQKEYNQTQFQSIREMVIRQSGIVLLQGPPGTGKTTALMGLLAAQYQYLKHVFQGQEDKRKIMICAPSNAAIDHITKRLVCEGLITHRSSSANTSISFSNSDEQPQIPPERQPENTPSTKQRVYPKVLRVGIVESNDPDIISVSLDEICDRQAMKAKDKTIKRNNMTSTQVKEKIISLSKEINRLNMRKDLPEMDREFKLNSMRNQIKRYQTLLYNFRKEKIELKQTYAQIEKRQLEEADIILTTLSSSGSERLERLMGFIGSLIVDEAAQATEPNLLIPFQSGVRKVLLIGDPCQLPSTTMSQDSKMTLFNRSLFERFLDSGVKPYFLNTQYRMAPLIRQFPSNTFYAGRLRDAESISGRYDQIQNAMDDNSVNSTLEPIKQFFNRNSIFIDVKYGEQEFVSNSYRNVGEASVIQTLIVNFIKNTDLSIGVITPYQAQRRYLLKQLKKQLAGYICQDKKTHKKDMQEQQEQQGQCEPRESQEQPNNENKLTTQAEPEDIIQERVMINTVDSFQGQEKDIIIVSTVRANDRKDIGFLKDERRINVALTRSRHLLLIVGNGDTMGSNQIWNGYCEWAEKNKSYYSIKNEQKVDVVLKKIHEGPSEEVVCRKRYKNLTRDWRKQERSEIKREDFGLGAAKKKVKRDEPVNKKQQHHSYQPDPYVPAQPLIQIIQEEVEPVDQQQLIQQKRARESEVANFQEMNRRMKEVEERLAKNSGWSQLFK